MPEEVLENPHFIIRAAVVVGHDPQLHKHRREIIAYSVLGTLLLAISILSVYLLIRKRVHRIREEEDSNDHDAAVQIPDLEGTSSRSPKSAAGASLQNSVAMIAEKAEADHALNASRCELKSAAYDVAERTRSGERSSSSIPSDWLFLKPDRCDSISPDDSISVVVSRAAAQRSRS